VAEAGLAEALIRRLEGGLSPSILTALTACRRLAGEQGVALYLVGGAVRDLLLERPGYDLDLALEGDAAEIAGALARETGGRMVAHARFRTARVSGPGFRLDLARTRRESYPHPGALPVVEPATLAEDLARRDFTVNAIALRLEPGPPEIIDPYRGVADTRSRLIRVLHDRSFQDDATRMLRAVRYAARLGFKVATQTEALIGRDLSYLGTVSGPRLRRELALLFEEPTGPEGARLAQQSGVLASIHPALGLARDAGGRWSTALAGPKLAPLDELGFCVVADPADEGTAASVSKWLHLTGRVERALGDLVRLKSLSPKLSAMSKTPSAATELLDGYAPAAVWAQGVLAGGEVAATCDAYLTAWRHVRSELTGDDLLGLGMTPGPQMGAALARLRAARLDGLVTARTQEIELVRRLT
jgi:tRNA nucleotidyltransferase (CCA-adding enzyme)